MSTACLFCSIISGQIPANLVTSNEGAIAFADINPQAPTHVLVVPRTHHRNIVELGSDPTAMQALMDLIAQLGLAAGERGFRVVFNTGPDAGQSVDHVHAHLLAGRDLRWPPG